MCAVPNVAVFCSSLTSCFLGMLLTYFLIIIIIIIIINWLHFLPDWTFRRPRPVGDEVSFQPTHAHTHTHTGIKYVLFRGFYLFRHVSFQSVISDATSWMLSPYCGTLSRENALKCVVEESNSILIHVISLSQPIISFLLSASKLGTSNSIIDIYSICSNPRGGQFAVLSVWH